MTIQPFFIGSGRAANALRESLLLLDIQHPEWNIKKPIQLERNQKLDSVAQNFENPILFIANPPGLHAAAIQEGEKAGFRAIVVEKPACVGKKEVEALEAVRIPVAVCHIYRQMWGLQAVQQMLSSGELGELICIEGRYWQSSTAQRAIEPQPQVTSWKNDTLLSGDGDALLDVGVHWIDAVTFLMNGAPTGGRVWRSYANAEAPHRESHVHLGLEFANGKRAMGSISKTVHGATNHFEINVIGTRKSATWTFLNPDEIWIGQGISRTVLTRKNVHLGSKHPPFHGLGWLEGYIEIIRQLILDMRGEGSGNYPKLSDNLKMLNAVFSLET